LIGANTAQGDPREITIRECAYCHGQDGIAPDRDVPHLAGQNEGYLFNQMMAFRAGQRKHRDMRYLTRLLSVDELQAIAAYYASLPMR
jgi:cytochrome c553